MLFIAFDCETGGFDAETRSLLEAYFLVFDENFTPVADLHLFIKPDKGVPYQVDAEALEVNGINLVEHDKKAMTLQDAKTKLYNFLETTNPGGAQKMVPVGQNVYFDLDFLFNCLVRDKTWKKYCSYHVVDTAGIAQLMKIMGLMPIDNKTSLGELAKFFNIKTGKLHGAKEDTVVSVKVFRAMKELLGRR